jgi:hypothetical protein
MPAASAGNVLFSKLVAFKEATPGTIPTLTSGGRKLLVTPTGVITDGVTIELGTERSVALRNPLIGSTGTITAIEPTLSATVPAVSIGELPIWLSMTKTDTVAGTAAPYEWDYDYSMTAANNPTSYTLVATDGIQQYAVNYCLAESITIAADRNGLTNLSANLFAQNVAKNSATLAEGTPTSPFLSGRLWNAYQHGSSFPGTADGTAYTYLLDFSLEFNAGITRQSYLAGTTTFSTHAESAPFSGTLTMTVSSTASAVSTWCHAERRAPHLDKRNLQRAYSRLHRSDRSPATRWSGRRADHDGRHRHAGLRHGKREEPPHRRQQRSSSPAITQERGGNDDATKARLPHG